MLLFHERYKSQLNIFVMVLSCFIVISELCPLDHPNWRQSSHHSFASFFSVSPWLREQIWSSRLWTTGTVSCVGEFALWSWHPRISETCGRREDSFWECQFLFLYLSRSCSPPPPALHALSLFYFICTPLVLHFDVRCRAVKRQLKCLWQTLGICFTSAAATPNEAPESVCSLLLSLMYLCFMSEVHFAFEAVNQT